MRWRLALKTDFLCTLQWLDRNNVRTVRNRNINIELDAQKSCQILDSNGDA